MNKLNIEKGKWSLLLFVAVVLFTFALVTEKTWLNIPAILLAFVIHKFGSPILFSDYYERKRKRQAKLKEKRREK